MKHISGHGRGHHLGAPTLNLEGDPGWRYGVYALWIEALGVRLPAVANWGARPTFEESQPVLEVHVLAPWPEMWSESQDFQVSGPIFLREIVRFESPEALQQQIQRDVEMARSLLLDR